MDSDLTTVPNLGATNCRWHIETHGTLPTVLNALSSTVADLREAPSYGPKPFQFHAVLWKIWQNRMLAPPLTGNPGSAPDQLLSITLGPA